MDKVKEALGRDEWKLALPYGNKGYWGSEFNAASLASERGNDNNYCVPWGSETKETVFDASWRFGRFVAIFGSIICVPVFLLSFYVFFYKVTPKIFKITLIANISMAILSLMLLVGLGSQVCDAIGCQMGPGSYLAILDFFLWMVAAAFAFKLHKLSQDPELKMVSMEQPLPALPLSESSKLPALPPSETLSEKV